LINYAILDKKKRLPKKVNAL